MTRLIRTLASLLCLFFALPGCDELPATKEGKTSRPAANEETPPRVVVHVFNDEGELVGPLETPAVRRTREAWKVLLTREQYRILRRAGTERAFCGTLLDNKRVGVYTCAGCGLPLFSSDAKYKSRTGWPSFFQPIAEGNIEERADRGHRMTRTEILCARCEGHLGHVFRDGPQPTGLRYCLNSESLEFTDSTRLRTLADPAARQDPAPEAAEPPRATAVFAGGCFWCVEAVFEELEGVVDAVSGYAGGSADTATYDQVSSGRTKHAEAVKIIYDPTKVTYEELLEVHFATHDPTTLNRQGADVGTHYRSTIFYADEVEKEAAAAYIAKLQETLGPAAKIVTTLEPLEAFHEAEPSHQNFVCDNPNQDYVRAVARPKVEKARKQFREKVKTPPADSPK